MILRRSTRALCLVLVTTLVTALVLAPVLPPLRSAVAQPTFQIGQGVGEEQVTIDADSIAYDQDGTQLRAEGDVVISSGATVLAADEISVRRASGEADASGDVLLDDPEARVRAERAWLELDDETGFLVDGEVHLRRSRFLLSGERLEKGLGQSYRIWDGELTTCLCDHDSPDWSIHGEEIDVDLGGWGEVQGGVFKVKDIPILYFPYGILPVGRQRQSGFLFPRFGISNRRGFQYVQPFYWAIDKSSDVVLSVDIETDARVGLLGDYRYALSPTAGGRLSASYFYEFDPDEQERRASEEDPNIFDPSVPYNRWSVIGNHQNEGPLDSRVYARPFFVSDNVFLRDMNTLSFLPATNLFLTTIRYTTSEVGIVKVGPWGDAKAEAKWFQNFYQDQKRQPQPVPNLTLRLRERFFQLLTGRINTQAVYYYRDELSSGARLDIAPELSMPFRLGKYGYGSARLQLRETMYYLTDNNIPVGFPREDGTINTRTVDRFQHRELLTAQISFGSEVSRVYRFEGSELQKLKHTIEPFVSYVYIPFTNQSDQPVWDFVDRINARNLVTYGFMTRFLGKFGEIEEEFVEPLAEADAGALPFTDSLVGQGPYGPMPPGLLAGSGGPSRIRELGRIRVQQSYAIRYPPTVSVDNELRTQNFSGIDLYGRITPVTWAGLTSQAVYSPIDNKFVYASVGANVWDPRPIEGEGEQFQPALRPVNSASIFYQFNTNGAVENLNMATTFRITNHLAVSYLGRFDGESGRFLENWGGMRVISGCDCWTIDGAIGHRFINDEFFFRAQVTLVGLGTFGQSPFGGYANPFPTPTSNGPDFGAIY